jgi:hypothetical protein
MSLLKELAVECFRSGKTLQKLIEDEIQKEFDHTLQKSKTLFREGADVSSVRETLIVEDGLTPAAAAALSFEAQSQVVTEQANEIMLRKATQSAEDLYKNGCRFSDVMSNLISQGVGRDLAERIAKENQHHYRP